MKFEWVKWKEYDEDINATNIGTAFIFIKFNWPLSFSWYSYRYDGLPLRGVYIGFIYIGCGITHHWDEA